MFLNGFCLLIEKPEPPHPMKRNLVRFNSYFHTTEYFQEPRCLINLINNIVECGFLVQITPIIGFQRQKWAPTKEASHKVESEAPNNSIITCNRVTGIRSRIPDNGSTEARCSCFWVWYQQWSATCAKPSHLRLSEIQQRTHEKWSSR